MVLRKAVVLVAPGKLSTEGWMARYGGPDSSLPAESLPPSSTPAANATCARRSLRYSTSVIRRILTRTSAEDRLSSPYMLRVGVIGFSTARARDFDRGTTGPSWHPGPGLPPWPGTRGPSRRPNSNSPDHARHYRSNTRFIVVKNNERHREPGAPLADFSDHGWINARYATGIVYSPTESALTE